MEIPKLFLKVSLGFLKDCSGCDGCDRFCLQRLNQNITGKCQQTLAWKVRPMAGQTLCWN